MGAYAIRTRFERNAVGVKAAAGKPVVLSHCVATVNNTGFLAEPNGELIIPNSLVTKNTTGIATSVTGRAFIASSTISSNNKGIEVGNIVRSLGNNMIFGNEIEVSGRHL